MRHLHLFQTVKNDRVVTNRGRNVFDPDRKTREYNYVTLSSLRRISMLEYAQISGLAKISTSNAHIRNTYPKCVKYSYVIAK